MAAHSSVLAWRIPQTEEPGRLQSLRSQRTGHNRGTEHARVCEAFQAALVANSLPVSAGDTRDVGSSPESGRSPWSILAWRIPWTDELGGLQSLGPQRVRHDSRVGPQCVYFTPSLSVHRPPCLLVTMSLFSVSVPVPVFLVCK